MVPVPTVIFAHFSDVESTDADNTEIETLLATTAEESPKKRGRPFKNTTSN